MPSRSTRDNTLAGLFVLGGLALAVWASFMLGEQSGLGATSNIIVRFPVELGAGGIKPGSPVLLGGQKIGRVTKVTFNPLPPAAPTGVDVQVEVPEAIVLYENANFALERPLLGSLSSINISGAGGKIADGATPKQLASGAIIAGGLAPPALLTQAGITSKEIDGIKSTIKNLEQSLTRIAAIINDRAPDVEDAIKNANKIVSDLRDKLKPWSESVDGTLNNINTASAKIEPILSDAKDLMKDAKAFIAAAQMVIDDNRENIATAVKSIKSAAGKFDEETLNELTAAFEKGRNAVDALAEGIHKISGLIDSGTPNIHHTLANIRLMSDNLKLATSEIRSQPWRLMHKPTNKELSTQVLYDATRAYAEASSDLRSASEAMQALFSGTGAKASPPDAAIVQQVTLTLREALEKYQDADRRLLEILIREDKK